MANMVEKVARALCWANGMDPELSLGGDKQNFLWMEYEHQAKAAIRAYEDVSGVTWVCSDCGRINDNCQLETNEK